MTQDELEHLLDRCGGDAGAWPPGAGAAAQRLLAGSAEARAAVARAQALDQRLRATRVEGAVPGMASRAVARPQARSLPVLRLGVGAAGIAAVVTLCAGLAVGGAERATLSPERAAAAALAAPAEAGDAG